MAKMFAPKEIGRKDATCTEDGWVKYECTYESDRYATAPEHKDQWVETIPATGHHWKDNGNGTHTCTNCGATEALPADTNSALELRVVDAEGMNQPFTVSQNGTLRTYTGAYDTATLTGDLDTLRYLQDHGAQTIQFVTNGQTSSFAINDLLAQGSGSEAFYLTHRGAEEPAPAAGGGRPQRTGERLTNPGGGVYRKAPLASLLQKPPALPHRAGGFFWL